MVRPFVLILILCVTRALSGQSMLPDSVEATVIHFKVLPPLDKNGLPKNTVLTMHDFYYILWGNYVIIKEIELSQADNHRLFHLDKQIFWWCQSIEGVIHRDYPERHEVQNGRMVIQREMQSRILELPVFKCQVILDKEKDTLTAWQTEHFRVNFSTIGTLPGVPLYYEKYWQGNKLRFVAKSIDTQILSYDFFNVLRMPLHLIGYSGGDFWQYQEDRSIRKGSRLPYIHGKSLQGQRIRLPAETPALLCFLRTGDVHSGFAEIAIDILRANASKISCVVVFDREMSLSQEYVQDLMDICPVLDKKFYTFQKTGIPSTAFFVVADKGGFIDEIVFPLADGWKQALSTSIKKVLKK